MTYIEETLVRACSHRDYFRLRLDDPHGKEKRDEFLKTRCTFCANEARPSVELRKMDSGEGGPSVQHGLLRGITMRKLALLNPILKAKRRQLYNDPSGKARGVRTRHDRMEEILTELRLLREETVRRNEEGAARLKELRAMDEKNATEDAAYKAKQLAALDLWTSLVTQAQPIQPILTELQVIHETLMKGSPIIPPPFTSGDGGGGGGNSGDTRPPGATPNNPSECAGGI